MMTFQMELLHQKQPALLPKGQGKAGSRKGTAKTLPDESQKTSAAGQGSTSTPTTSVPAGGYKDGTYQGSGAGLVGRSLFR